MSYNLVNSTTGELTRVAGRGKAEYGASAVRSGTYTPSGPVQPQEDLSFSVTFSEPMPDNDYQVIFGSSSNDTASGTMQCVVRSRSTTGFTGVIRNVGTSTVSAASGIFTWFAFKLYSDVEYSNIVNSMPSDASASNKLATMSMLPEFKDLVTGNADELRSFAVNKLYSVKVANPFNVMDDDGNTYQIPALAEAIFYKHAGDLTVQFHSYYGISGIWEIFYNSNGQTRGKKVV